ncbi:MAG: T9SS type A sorting domain-containing protein [Ignavibacteriaceae bacterium]|nr:T9SS type A sorting domain-containing protein [Ignavibacteriaceae bacterium]
MIVYNNYIYAAGHLLPGGDPYINAAYCRWYGYNYHPLSYWIHNTLVTANGGESPLVMEYMAFFKNNIIVQYGTNGQNPSVYGGKALATVTSTNPSMCPSCNPPSYVYTCTNNLFWREWGDISFTGQFNGNGITGTPTGWSSWSNTYGGTGINANPLFVNNVRQNYGYIISSNSPAINQGSNLKTFIEDKELPWTDILGNPRDSSPDIGAYQFTGSDSTFQLVVNITDGRNLVSVPGINPSGMVTTDWWPNLTGTVYKLVPGSGYVEVTSTTPSVGYWIKNTGTTTYYYPELVRVAHNPIAGASGWNMIGGYELSVNAANITTIPPGLRSGPIYKYSGAYKTATKIDPGYGYWIKLAGAGQVILPETVAKEQETKEWFPEDWGRIMMTDAAGSSYTLYSVKGDSPNGGARVNLDDYELPPIPPSGMFDIRFSSGRIAEDLNGSVKEINLSGVTYPLTIRVEGMDIKLMDESGRINVKLKSGENAVISDATVMKLIVSVELIPSVYALEQNYPNPFNPNTVIEYSLPEATFVSLTIYNTLGQKVTELVNGRLEAGHYNYQWNASNVATGMYIYEFRTDKFVSVKKMILLR